MQYNASLIQTKLFSISDENYKAFNKTLIPSVDEKTMIGIRVPMLRKFAKEFFKEEPVLAASFLNDLPHKYFEENHLHGFIIENIPDFNKALIETEKFLPYIDNWATCDCFAPKLFKQYPEKIYKKVLLWITSAHTYTVRYAIGLLLSNYLDEHFKPEMLDLVSGIKSDEYYVNMMIAWYFSFALIKQYKTALPYIENKKLSPFVHNKTIQKSIESRRIPKETKDILRTMKIKND